MENLLRIINKTFELKIKNIALSPTYWQAGAIIILLFLLVFTLARVRYLYVHWSLGKSAMAMIFWGFLLAMVVEGFLILSGRTLLTELLGWETAPKPISTALDIGKEKLVDVLGEQAEIPQSYATKIPETADVINMYDSLENKQKLQVREYICK